ncbi:hypothetical protein C8J57DRAFT_1062235 [Mycena rebaudengoi]|nr:hypothetical protein C8J57DRAFT_1062235 [Mycena rebaudengoi]
MVGRTISRDVKLAAMNLFERDILPLPDILDIVGFSESTFWHTRKLWRETGDVSKPKSSTAGRRRLLHREDLDYILRLVSQMVGKKNNGPSCFFNGLDPP